MAIEWIFIKDRESLRKAEDTYCVGDGDFGSPSEYPVYGFLHANFSEEQCIHFISELQLEVMCKNLKDHRINREVGHE